MTSQDEHHIAARYHTDGCEHAGWDAEDCSARRTMRWIAASIAVVAVGAAAVGLWLIS